MGTFVGGTGRGLKVIVGDLLEVQVGENFFFHEKCFGFCIIRGNRNRMDNLVLRFYHPPRNSTRNSL